MIECSIMLWGRGEMEGSWTMNVLPPPPTKLRFTAALWVVLVVILNGVQEAASCQHQGKGSDAFLMILRLGEGGELEPPPGIPPIENLEQRGSVFPMIPPNRQEKRHHGQGRRIAGAVGGLILSLTPLILLSQLKSPKCSFSPTTTFRLLDWSSN
jgi:hypothetical protein